MIMEKRCPYCKGKGTLPDPHGILSNLKSCPVCMGKGFNLIPKDAKHCSFCQGTGQVPSGSGTTTLCPDCKGLGSTW